MRNCKYLLATCVALLLIIPFSQDGLSQRKTATNGTPKAKDETHRAMKAAEVLTEMMAIPEHRIPDDLMNRAHGIAVIPRVVDGALGIGGRYGKGLMSQRMPNGQWSAPSFVRIEGGSFGPQIGVEATDVVLVFTDDEGIKGLLKGKVTLGADASVAAGPVGRTAEVGTDVLLKSSVLSYSRSKGVFAGVSLEGAALTIDHNANKKAYGPSVRSEDILVHDKVPVNAVVRPFVDALQKFSTSRDQHSKFKTP